MLVIQSYEIDKRVAKFSPFSHIGKGVTVTLNRVLGILMPTSQYRLQNSTAYQERQKTKLRILGLKTFCRSWIMDNRTHALLSVVRCTCWADLNS